MIALALVVTVRMSSTRLQGKALAQVCGRPALDWMVERLRRFDWERRGVDARVIVATSKAASDFPIVQWCCENGVECYRGSLENVLERIYCAASDRAVETGWPAGHPDFAVRVPGDCLMIEPEVICRAVQVMHTYGADGMMWYGPHDLLPCYGYREFPWSWPAWERALGGASGSQLEHTDAWFRENLDELHMVYHEPPPALYYRPYRFELDTEEDLAFFNASWRKLHRPPTMRQAILLLDFDPELAAINAAVQERTGPLISFSRETRDVWYASMRTGEVVVGWDDSAVRLGGVPAEAKAVYCAANHLLGYAAKGKGERGLELMRLHLMDGTVVDEGEVVCEVCGERRTWGMDQRVLRQLARRWG